MKKQKTQRQLERVYIDNQLKIQNEIKRKQEEFDLLPKNEKVKYYLDFIDALKKENPVCKKDIGEALKKLREIQDDEIVTHENNKRTFV